jgi:hypothetical protein
LIVVSLHVDTKFFSLSSVRQKGKISFFCTERFVFHTLKHPTIATDHHLISHQIVQLESEVQL